MTIEDIARRIVDSWGEWDEEAGRAANAAQDGEVGTELLVQRVKEAIDEGLESVASVVLEDLLCRAYGNNIRDRTRKQSSL